MPMDLTLTNIFQFISAISPILLGFFMIMISIFNQDLKGFIYLAGILITGVVNIFLLNMIGSMKSDDTPASCSLVNLPYNASKFNNPSLNSVFIAFTLIYLLLPMKETNQLNYPIISFISILFVIDAINKVSSKCTTIAGVITGLLVGFLFGGLWYVIFRVSGYTSLLYYDNIASNKVYCSRPKKQAFKCSVYKNGELVKTL